jgi:hypothetical protein
MGYEPIVYCRRCNEPLDVWQPYEHRFCGCQGQHQKHRLPVPPLEKRAFTTLENAGRCRRLALESLAAGDQDRAGIYKRSAYELLFYARKARLEAGAA